MREVEMMTSSEAASRRSMTGMPDKPAALGRHGRKLGTARFLQQDRSDGL